MKVKVANISTNIARAGQACLSIHISTVHIYLASIFMDNLAHFNNPLLINTVR